MKTTRLIHALWVAALAIGFAGCASDNEPTSAAGKDADSQKELTFTAGTPDDGSTQTRVAYEDTERKLTWQADDKLLMAGFDAVGYKESKEYTYEGTPGVTSGDFSGTAVSGATTYTAYYPHTVKLDNAGANPTLSMDVQTQSADDNTDHLKDYMLLQATEVIPDVPFSLEMKSSIMKFDLKNIPADVGKLRSLIWRVSSNNEDKSLKLNFPTDAVTFDDNKRTLTAYLSFMPADMKVPANGKFTVVLIGDKACRKQIEVSSGKTYDEGKRYTAEINDGWESMDQMTFTIRVTDGNLNFTPFFASLASAPKNVDLIIDWGDNAKLSYIPERGVINSHNYLSAGVYAITICSAQTNVTEQQIPRLLFKGKSLLSIETPLLNTAGADDWKNCFENCTELTSLSNDLFAKNTAATSFGYCFSGCTGLTSLPAGLFDANAAVMSFYACFKGCTGIESLPVGLFAKNTDVNSFSSCFHNCTSLTDLPSGLFDGNVNVTSFYSCFNGCSNLSKLPEGLFAKNIVATDFESCFRDCKNLKLNKLIFGFTGTGENKEENMDRFKDMDMNFKSCFYNVGKSLGSNKAGEAPMLWEYKKGVGDWVTDDCFYGATNLSNYNENKISIDWR